MKNIKAKIIIIALAIIMLNTIFNFAATLDPTIPTFDANNLSLNSDGTAHFVAPTYTQQWKRFDIQLLVRQTTTNAATGTVYTYKTKGSIAHVDPSDTSHEFSISSTGYYQFQIRGVNLEGNYGNWAAIYDNSIWVDNKTSYPGVAVTEDDISVGGNTISGSGIGSNNDYNSGPGVVNQSGLPYGYQYAIIGPNGQIIYNYGNNNNYQQQGNSMTYGPAYSNQFNQNGTNLYPNTGASNYQVVPEPFGNNSGQYSQYNQSGQNSQTNPNYYSGSAAGNNNYSPNNNTGTSTPQITQGLEIGWHVDQNGRFYYQGNGVVLKSTWYFIDGNYYRFSDYGYLLANQWFKDNTTGYWYYLGGDGKMLIGWQCINGTWYYFKTQNGNGYGTMYMNTTAQITDNTWGTGTYAFDANGAVVMNAWYGGFYYDKNGKRTN